MKILLISLIFLSALPMFAQDPGLSKDTLTGTQELLIISNRQVEPTDTSRIRILRDTSDKQKENTVTELFILGKNAYKKGHVYKNSRYPGFKGHWSGFYYGFVNFADTDYAMYEGDKFMELDWSHSFALQFNVFKHSINLVPRNNFGLVWGVGFEYQRLRFEDNDRSITCENHQIIPVDLHEKLNSTNIKRSSFKNLYLTIPLMLELQLPAASHHRFYVSGGVMGGLRMHSKTKVIYKDTEGDRHKKKEKGNFNMVPFKADVIGRIGFNCLTIWGSYTLTNMFKADKGPELHAYTIGLGLSF